MTKKETARKKLNIAIICDAVDYTNGASVSARRFATRLAARGHKVIYVASKTPYASGDVDGLKTYRFRSVLVPKAEGKFYLAFPTVAEAKKILKKEKIDIIHIIIPFESGFSFMEAARSLGIKVVTHSHTQAENVFLHVPKILGRDVLSNIFTRYLFWMYQNSDALVYPTEFAREKSPKMDAKMRYEVISNGVDISFFKPLDPAPFFKKYDLSPNDKYIVFVGRLHPEKSIDTLIKAVPEIIRKQPKVRVLIIGEGHQRAELEALMKSMHLEEKITFFGKISEEHLKALAYNAADIFCLPSLAELEGMVVLEAMACGAPILIADAPNSASKYFVKKNGMLFKAEDPHDLAQKACAMLSNEKKLEAMGEQSLKDSKNYDINESVLRLENLYYSILQEKQG
jgi:glycosyltransferase involved in cell wall biosynthesis